MTSARQRIIRLFALRNKLDELTNVDYEALQNKQDQLNKWKGHLLLTWPMKVDLRSTGRSKQIVANSLYEEAFRLLEKNGHFEEKPKVNKILGKQQKVVDRSTFVQLSEENREKLSNVLTNFRNLKQNLQILINEPETVKSSSSSVDEKNVEKSDEEMDALRDDDRNSSTDKPMSTITDVITGFPLHERILIGEELELRNFALFKSLHILKHSSNPKIKRILNERRNLPINFVKDDLLDALEKNKVVLLRGDTGCGKTTQVPQYILERFIENMNGAACNVVVTQPRRISAISVAERIAKERNESIGVNVGYRVRLKQKTPVGNGSILFTTPGMLLRNRFTNPNFDGISHIVVDEVHERDIWTDFLLISIKRALKANKTLKVILMSATFGVEKFQAYFEECPVVETFGRKFDVEEYFKEDIFRMLENSNSSYSSFTEIKEETTTTDFDLVVDTIFHIHETKEPGAILCFLPTSSDIKTVQKLICEKCGESDEQKIVVLPCHSRLPIDEQEKVFIVPPNGVRKIILATNIAETSITINDVKYVVNSGTHKAHVFDKDAESMRITENWACRAAQLQRKGRAGRVSEGQCYHLFSKRKYDELAENFTPELLRAHLANVVLLAKIFGSDEDPSEFLSEAPDPPNNYQLDAAVDQLTSMKLLDENRNLTRMGRVLAPFGCSPMLAKAMLYGVVLKCIDPILSIAAYCETKDGVLTPLFRELEKSRRLEIVENLMGSSFSDYILSANAFKIVREELERDSKVDRKNLDENLFNKRNMLNLRGLYASDLIFNGLCANQEEILNLDGDLNSFKNNENLIKCAMAAGCHQNLLRMHIPKSEKKSSKIYFVDSLRRLVSNYRQSQVDLLFSKEDGSSVPPSFWFNCFQKILDMQGRAYKIDSLSMLHPLAAILFSGFSVIDSGKNSAIVSLQPSVDFNFRFENVNDKLAIIELRRVIDEFVEWRCAKIHEKVGDSPQYEQEFRAFHSLLLDTIVSLLEFNDSINTNRNKKLT